MKGWLALLFLLAGPVWADAGDRMAKMGLSYPAPPPLLSAPSGFAETDGAVLELVDLRFLLARLAAQTGAKDHALLIAAQPQGASKALLLRGGYVTLSGLAALAANSPAAPFVQTGSNGLTLTRPLAIWADAGLHLGAGDELRLDRASGSFLVTFGWLDMAGASLGGTPIINPHAAEFRPFVLGTGDGQITVQDSRLAALGFGASGLFGGVTIAPTGLATHAPPVLIRASRFADVGRLALIRTTGSRLTDSQLSGTNVLLSATRGASITGNQFGGSRDRTSLRIGSGFADVTIAGNSFAAPGATAITVEDGTGLRIIANRIEGQGRNGITLNRLSCALVQGNLIAGNGANGIVLRDSAEVTVAGNALLGNSNAGLYLRDQAAAAQSLVAGNVIAGNGVGMRGASTGAVALSDNRMQGQAPRLFSGDLAGQTVVWLTSKPPTQPPEPSAIPSCLMRGAG
jgi:poly(beta-D-mannuronate) C5 epimerase